jgi:16S rRNA C967 or C1407 C5-methylase (RsmB/RsmF family)
MIADLLSSGTGTVTGVDSCSSRLLSTRSILKKYAIQNVRLFVGDGTTFTITPQNISSIDSSCSTASSFIDIIDSSTNCSILKLNKKQLRGKRKAQQFRQWKQQQINKQIKQHHETSINEMSINMNITAIPGRSLASSDSSCSSCCSLCRSAHCVCVARSGPVLYDKVLVDAECTHDGSIRHILKYHIWGWNTFEQRFLHLTNLEQLTLLQRNLLQNGFKLLKIGGILIYSTCR